MIFNHLNWKPFYLSLRSLVEPVFLDWIRTRFWNPSIRNPWTKIALVRRPFWLFSQIINFSSLLTDVFLTVMVQSSSRFSRINQYSLKLMYLTSLLSSDTQVFVLNRPFWPFFLEPKRNSRIRTKSKPNPNSNKYTFNQGPSPKHLVRSEKTAYEKIWTGRKVQTSGINFRTNIRSK